MTKKGNLCPDCNEELEEHTDPEFKKVYFAQRELCADVICPGCGLTVNISGGTVTAQFVRENLEQGSD